MAIMTDVYHVENTQAELEKINALDLTLEDLITLITESVSAAIGGNRKRKN